MTENVTPKRSRELVREIAQRILAAGEQPPTQALIRETIFSETGVRVSPNLVNDEIKAFWADMGKQLAAKMHRPGVPEPVSAAIEAIWDVALKEALGTLESERREAKDKIALAEARVAASIDHANQLLYQLEVAKQDHSHIEQTLTVAQEKIADLEEANRKLAQEVLELTAANVAAHRDMAAQEQRNQLENNRLTQAHAIEIQRNKESHESEIKRITDTHVTNMASIRAEMARQAESWDGARQHLMQETARVRDAMRAEVERLGRELDDTKQIESQLRRQRSDAIEQNAMLKGRLEQVERELHRAQDNLLLQAKEHAKEVERLQAALTSDTSDHTN